jgi:endonuclease YncB( thermonuclease family)
MSFLRRPRIPASVRMPPWWRRPNVRRWLLVVGVLVAAGALDRLFLPRRHLDDWGRYHEKTFRVVQVLDGDTFDIDISDGEFPTTRIRLWGVDTPELAMDGDPAMHFGPEASAFAKETLLDRPVYLVLAPHETRGKYGRLLAYAYLEPGGAMFNRMLIEQGYAYADHRFEHPYRTEFKQIEKRARRDAIGLWEFVTIEQMPAWRQRFERRAASR